MVALAEVLPFLLLLLILAVAITLIILLTQAQQQRENEARSEEMEALVEETRAAAARGVAPGPRRGSRLRRRALIRGEPAERQDESEVDAGPTDGGDPSVPAEATGSKIKKKKEANKEQKRAEQEARRSQLEQKRLEEEEYWEEQAIRKEEEREAAVAAEEEERKVQEEKEKKEQEEYDQWKDLISVENEGDEDAAIEAESEGLLAEFIEYIKRHKVVVLEELAAEFKLRTEEAVNRVEALEAMGSISGVFDDRGKFIYVGMEELQSIAGFIKKKGRVSIADLASEASKVVLQPAGEPGATS